MSKSVSITSSKKSSARSRRSVRRSKPDSREVIEVAAPILASSLPLGSTKQRDLIHSRISAETCLECGNPRGGGDYDFCRDCIEKSQKDVGVATPIYGWSYRVRQIKPALPECGAFLVIRVGVFENEGRTEFLYGQINSFEEAKSLASKKHERATRAVA